jgi:hypothetical protein
MQDDTYNDSHITAFLSRNKVVRIGDFVVSSRNINNSLPYQRYIGTFRIDSLTLIPINVARAELVPIEA